MSEGEPNPISVPFTSPNSPIEHIALSTVPSAPLSPMGSPVHSPAPSPVPSPALPSPVPSPALSPCAAMDASNSDTSSDAPFLPDSCPTSEDFSATADVSPSPPSSPVSRRRNTRLPQTSPVPLSPVQRKTMPGKIISSVFLTTCGLDYVAELLRFQGWDTLFAEQYDYHPSLMTQFYNSLILGSRDVYGMFNARVTLNCSVFAFSSGELGVYLGVPIAGFSEYYKDGWNSAVRDHDPLTIVYKFTGKDLPTPPVPIPISHLNPQYRVLSLVAKALVPRAGGRNIVTAFELLIMDLLDRRQCVNLPAIVLQHMLYAKTTRTHAFPFGMWLTKLFMRLSIDFADSIPKSITEAHHFRRASFSLMGIQVDGQGKVLLGPTAAHVSPPPPVVTPMDRKLASLQHQVRVLRSQQHRQYKNIMALLKRTQAELLASIQSLKPSSP